MPGAVGSEMRTASAIGPVVWSLLALAVVWLTANAVNFADGLDGLLAGSAIPPLTLLTAIAYWQYRHPDAYATQEPLHLASCWRP